MARGSLISVVRNASAWNELKEIPKESVPMTHIYAAKPQTAY